MNTRKFLENTCVVVDEDKCSDTIEFVQEFVREIIKIFIVYLVYVLSNTNTVTPRVSIVSIIPSTLLNNKNQAFNNQNIKFLVYNPFPYHTTYTQGTDANNSNGTQDTDANNSNGGDDIKTTTNDKLSSNNSINIQEIEQDRKRDEEIQEETTTIHKVIVILCSLGGALLLVAIAIAMLYWKVRQQQKITSAKYLSNHHDDITPLSRNSENNSYTDGGSEKSTAPTEPPVHLLYNIQVHNLPPQATAPTAPPAEKIDLVVNDYEDDNEHLQGQLNRKGHSLNPHPTLPPAYTPTAPPLYSLSSAHHPDYNAAGPSIQDIILSTEGAYFIPSVPVYPSSAIVRSSTSPIVAIPQTTIAATLP
ncbi:6336_t:CDS:2, partial [Ambispora gerdemannii]